MIVTTNQLRALEREALRIISESSAPDVLEGLIEETKKKSGRPRELTVRALFVGVQLLSMSGHYFLCEVPTVLNGLSSDIKKRLGLSHKITNRKVTYLFSRIDDVLRTEFANEELSDEERFADFDRVFSALSSSGGHVDANGSLSISVDGSDVPTWANDRNVYRLLEDPETGEVDWAKVRLTTDRDAGWRGSKNVENKPMLFGYELTAAVSVRDVNGPEVPRTTLAARFRPVSKSDSRTSALAVVKEVKEKRGALGDVLVDRGYTQSKHGNDFLNPVRALGGEPVFDLKENQLGTNGTVRGAIIIDGAPFSPSIPNALKKLTPPRPTGTGVYLPHPGEVADYQAKIAQRARYAMVPHGKVRENGTAVFQCPGAAGKLVCPLQVAAGALQNGALPAANPPKRVVADSVCARRYSTFDIATDLPLYQRDLYGSKQWLESYRRRGTSIEPHFGAMKDESMASFRRGKVRVRGLVKTGLMVAFALATTNRRLALAWEERQKKNAPRTSTRHQKTPRARYHHALTEITLAPEDQHKVLAQRRT